MTIIIVLLTIGLILDCLLLGLLILIQLPKKEAGVGVAFGGGATDALFGAGSGTALTQLTKYTATAFFVLVFMLSVLNTHARHSSTVDLKRQMEKQAHEPLPLTSSPATATTNQTPAAKAPGISLMSTSNAPAATATSTNPPGASAK